MGIKISTLYKDYIFKCMDKILVPFEIPHTISYTLKDVHLIKMLRFNTAHLRYLITATGLLIDVA